jgi:uncharacterized membrane protein (DUF485 family)
MTKKKEIDWAGIADSKDFRLLLIAKARFIVPATIFFILYYFALPISVGYFPEFMSQKVLGPLNIAYLFALSQFFMAWVIAALYVRAAGRFDKAAHALVGHLHKEPKP